MKTLMGAAIAVLSLALTAGKVHAAVITFDELDASSDLLLDVYADLTWTNIYAFTSAPGFEGFNNGIVSGVNGAYSGGELFDSSVLPVVGGFTAKRSFDFKAAQLGAAYYNDLILTVQGFRAGAIAYSRDVTVSTTGATAFAFDFDDIDAVQIFASATSSTTDPFGCGAFNCTQFTLDDVSIVLSPIPEPSAPVLALSGIAWMAWRRTKSLRPPSTR